MANDDRHIVRFNFNFKASTQARGASNKPTANTELVAESIAKGITYAIGDIAFYGTKSQQSEIQRAIAGKMEGIVNQEMGRMARAITSTKVMGLAGYRHSPEGTLEVTERSVTLSQTNPTSGNAMSISSVTGAWRERSTTYLQRKGRKYGHRRWWLAEGDLRRALSNPDLYTRSFGPVKVRWIPERVAGVSENMASRFSNLARGRGRSYRLTIGRIEMSIMGRITSGMLADPGQPAHNSKFNGLFDLLPLHISTPLGGQGDPRPLIEPFLTFWINRQLPNRLFRAIENSIKTR